MTARASSGSCSDTNAAPPDGLREYLDGLGRYKLLSSVNERELAERAREGDQDAFEKLVRGNLRFVVHVARRYKGSELTLEDLIAEGNAGLVEAAKRFDSARGVRLVSYAEPWIRHSMQRAIRAQRWMTTGCEPNIDQRSSREGGFTTTAPVLVSLDSALSNDTSQTWSDVLPDERMPRTDHAIERTELSGSVSAMLDSLIGRDAEMLRYQFGLQGRPRLSPRDTAARMGLPMRVVIERTRAALVHLRASHAGRALLALAE